MKQPRTQPRSRPRLASKGDPYIQLHICTTPVCLPQELLNQHAGRIIRLAGGVELGLATPTLGCTVISHKNAVKTPRLIGGISVMEQLIQQQCDGMDMKRVTHHAATQAARLLHR